MNINEEVKYYASMVRKFRTEYKSKNLHGFCKEQKVSYTKMLHCLRNDSYRKPSATPVFLIPLNSKMLIIWIKNCILA